MQKLNRILSPFGTLGIVLSICAPLSAFFIIVPAMVTISGTGGIYSFLLATFVAYLFASIWGELASAFPISGGEYSLIGKTIGRFWSFITLIFLISIAALSISFFALGFGQYAHAIFPFLNMQLIAFLAIIIATILGIFHIEFNAKITSIFLIIQLLILLGIFALGCYFMQRPLSELFFHPIYLDTSGRILPANFGVILAAIGVGINALYGFGAANAFGEEILDVRKNIAKIMKGVVVTSAIFQFLPLIGIFLGVSDIGKMLEQKQDFMVFFLNETIGGVSSLIINISIMISASSCIIGIVLHLSRQIYSSARDQLWFSFANKELSKIHPRYGSPHIATITVGILSFMGSFLDMSLLILITSSTIIFIALLLAIGSVAGRLTGSTQKAQYKTFLFPLPQIVVIGVLFYVIYQNWMDPELGRPSIIATGIIFLASSLYYLIFLARKKDWIIHDPDL